jgi:hypothetical protein
LLGALAAGGISGCLGDRTEEATPTVEQSGTNTRTTTPKSDSPEIAATTEENPLPEDADILDRLIFGNEPSESNHNIATETSRLFDTNGTVARRVLPPTTESEQPGLGSVSFTMSCDPSSQTFLTVKFRQQPAAANGLLFLFDGDNMVGLTGDEGAWNAIEPLTPGGQPGTHGEWIYSTHRIPQQMTEGANEVELRIVSWDPEGPSKGLFRAYTHTEPLFDLPSDESTDDVHDLGSPAGPSSDPMAAVREEIEREVAGGQDQRTVEPIEALGLAMAHSRDDWIDAVEQEAILETVRSTIDRYAILQNDVEDLSAGALASFPGFLHTWYEHGFLARAFELLADRFEDRGWLTEPIPEHPDAGSYSGDRSRRQAYAKFFDRALTWRTKSRRIALVNQMMHVTLALPRMNRAIERLDPTLAREEELVAEWADEVWGVTGITHHKGENKHPHNASGSYHMVTEAGLGKELGYSCGYGQAPLDQGPQLADEMALDRLVERTADSIKAMGELKWRMQDPDPDSDIMRVGQDGVISVRNSQHPGQFKQLKGYGFRPFYIANLTGDEVAKRWAELTLEHGVADMMTEGTKSAHGAGLETFIHRVEGYRGLQEMEPSEYVLPWNRDWHVWSDPDMGIVTLTDGETRMMVSLGHGGLGGGHDWGVTGIASFHYSGPKGDRDGTALLSRMEFPTNGETWTYPNNLTLASENDEGPVERYLPWKDSVGTVNQALAGEEYPVTSQPSGEPWPRQPTWGPEPRAGMWIHYREVDIGPYRIGLNSTGNEQRGWGSATEFQMNVPDGSVVDVDTGEPVTSDRLMIGPREARVLKIESA